MPLLTIHHKTEYRYLRPVAFGEHRIMLSDAETMNRLQMMAGGTNRYIDIPQAVSLINQERTNSNLYVSLLEPNPTAYYDDKAMPSLPGSLLNVMQAGRASSRTIVTAPESATVPVSQLEGEAYVLT